MNNMKELIFNVKGNTYKISCPTVGQFQNIESIKQVLSKGMYSALIQTNTVSSNKALDMIDVESYLSVLCPDLMKDLKCDSFSQLGLFDYIELKKIYDEQFVPWWNDLLKLISPEVNK